MSKSQFFQHWSCSFYSACYCFKSESSPEAYSSASYDITSASHVVACRGRLAKSHAKNKTMALIGRRNLCIASTLGVFSFRRFSFTSLCSKRMRKSCVVQPSFSFLSEAYSASFNRSISRSCFFRLDSSPPKYNLSSYLPYHLSISEIK